MNIQGTMVLRVGAIAAALTAAVAVGRIPLGRPPLVPAGAPAETHTEGTMGSAACKMCHPGEHASWQHTYHRTMTRRPAALLWNGVESPRLPTTLELDDRIFELTRGHDGQVRVTGPDLHVLAGHLRRIHRALDGAEASGSLDASDKSHAGKRAWHRTLAELPAVTRPIAQVTGSHNYLAFWVSDGDARELRQLPFVYLLGGKEEGRWAPRREVFLQPPTSLPHLPRWNANCIQCHAVAGQPHQQDGLDPNTGAVLSTYATEVGELGIACEACHGPGREHAARFRNPLARELTRQGRRPARDTPVLQGRDVAIANPGALDAERSSAVCGQCHAYFVPTQPEKWWDSGYVGLFTPGQSREDLAKSRQILMPNAEQLARVNVSRDMGSIFWGDGTIRVGGREYNSLLTSRCYTEGAKGEGTRGDTPQPGHAMSCASCHSLHDGGRADQLRPEVAADPNWACTSCHTDTPEHSGHRAESIGASCVNCHMPKTTYALMTGIRNHRVMSPSLRLADPPSACALCHVDRSKVWLEQNMKRLFPAIGHGASVDGLVGGANMPPSPDASQQLHASHQPGSQQPGSHQPGSQQPGSQQPGSQQPGSQQPDASRPLAREVPFAVHQALEGNAAVRAVFANALAQPEALSTAGTAISLAVLRQLTHDPYAAVQRIAKRNLAELESRATTPGAAAAPAAAKPQHGLALTEELLRRLHEMRDDTPIVISE